MVCLWQVLLAEATTGLFKKLNAELGVEDVRRVHADWVREKEQALLPKTQFPLNPGDQLQKCRSPVPTKVPKKCFGKCRPQTGCRGKCRKSASAFEPLYKQYRGSKAEALFRHFPRHPVWGRHFPKHFFGTFVGTGLRHFCSWSHLEEDPGHLKNILSGPPFAFLSKGRSGLSMQTGRC